MHMALQHKILHLIFYWKTILKYNKVYCNPAKSLLTETKPRLTKYFKRLQNLCHSLTYMLFILLYWMFHSVCTEQTVTLLNFVFIVTFWFCKLLACKNKKRDGKILIRMQHIVKFSRNNKKYILVLNVFIILHVNLHGNLAFAFVHKNDILAHERVTIYHPLRKWQTIMPHSCKFRISIYM